MEPSGRQLHEEVEALPESRPWFPLQQAEPDEASAAPSEELGAEELSSEELPRKKLSCKELSSKRLSIKELSEEHER